ncbi:hypothetical protein BJX61DRAFT_508216 [Aspergillus egyptiacus]|nr:hypothetical protein BJX61DRAFT_508216 [Aspergillus egyptiacus]
MAHRLPPELWAEIASYLERDDISLIKCARVCRQWQPIFERLIYQSVEVESEQLPGSTLLSLSQFQALMSGSNQYRQCFVRRLQFTVIMPYHLPYYEATKLEGYCEQNIIREANNQAFENGMSSLFEFLLSWQEISKLALLLTARGRDKVLEPQTEATPHAEQWQVEFDGERVIAPYRARFPANEAGAPNLPRITCIDYLWSEPGYQGICNSAVLQIAEHCVGLQRLRLNLSGGLRPDHVQYMRDRRQAVASGLPRLPASLRAFECLGTLDYPWSNTLPALDLRSASKVDELSSGLRILSCNLRELKLSVLSLDMDFLFPLNEDGNPLPTATSLHWPYLETIVLSGVPANLPCGEWLFDYELESGDEEHLPDPATGDDIFESPWLNGLYEISRDKMNTEHFHRLFISLGYAARRMPVLQTICFSLGDIPRTEFRFNSRTRRGGGGDDSTTSGGEKPCLRFLSAAAYRPDRRVADAWGFDLDNVVVEKDHVGESYHLVVSSVTLDRGCWDK